MKKCLMIILGIAAAFALIATVVVFLRESKVCPCEKIKAYFTEKDFTVLPMEENEEV